MADMADMVSSRTCMDCSDMAISLTTSLNDGQEFPWKESWPEKSGENMTLAL